MIVLIKVTKKLVKNSFLSNFGHKRQISNRPIWVKRGIFQTGFIMAAFIQEGKMPVDKDWFTMAVSRGTISLEQSNSKDVGIRYRTHVT